jgi:hypothetical protein
MPVYRFYFIRQDGHVAGPPVAADLPDDPDAISKAKELLNGKDAEIWEGARIVAYLVPDQDGDAGAIPSKPAEMTAAISAASPATPPRSRSAHK